MKLADLSSEERQALVVLVRRVVRADGQLSQAEIEAMSRLSESIPLDDWRAAVKEVQTSGLRKAPLEDVAAKVTRPQARSLILNVMRIISEVDGVAEAETALIHSVRRMWG